MTIGTSESVLNSYLGSIVVGYIISRSSKIQYNADDLSIDDVIPMSRKERNLVIAKRARMGFGRRLQVVLEEKNVSQYWLSKATGITAEGLRRIVREQSTPGWDSVVLIAQALEVEPSVFFDQDDPKPSETVSNRTTGRPGRRPKNESPDSEDDTSEN